MGRFTGCVLSGVILCTGFSTSYAASPEIIGASKQIQELNTQLQAQLKTIQETEEKQLQTLNKQLQAQMQEMQMNSQAQMQEMNNNMNKRMDAIQKDLQAQIKQVYDQTKKLQ